MVTGFDQVIIEMFVQQGQLRRLHFSQVAVDGCLFYLDIHTRMDAYPYGTIDFTVYTHSSHINVHGNQNFVNPVFFILTTEGSLVNKIDLQALHLSGTCHKTRTRPPSC